VKSGAAFPAISFLEAEQNAGMEIQGKGEWRDKAGASY